MSIIRTDACIFKKLWIPLSDSLRKSLRPLRGELFNAEIAE